MFNTTAVLPAATVVAWHLTILIAILTLILGGVLWAIKRVLKNDLYLLARHESLGHFTGDVLLKVVGDRFLACTPNVERVTRLGGDEFLVLINFEDVIDLKNGMDKVMGIFHREFPPGNYHLNLAASIGVALYPAHGHDVDGLLQAADVALHGVKFTGRNGWAFHDEDMSACQQRNGERGAGNRIAAYIRVRGSICSSPATHCPRNEGGDLA